jgi:hypothetical protein
MSNSHSEKHWSILRKRSATVCFTVSSLFWRAFPLNRLFCWVPKSHFPPLEIKKLLRFWSSALAVQLRTALSIRWQNDTILPVIRHTAIWQNDTILPVIRRTAISGLKPVILSNILSKWTSFIGLHNRGVLTSTCVETKVMSPEVTQISWTEYLFLS